ncbi:predicted protein [Lichtheimia corymbifera JMRC:FSU:9682]|uniref:Uncharacterized protein n=1 Tax=Lichtheimia corymbifera JMRC:FSU:9682 TaxID=1263082 RepID=A0A068S0C2_9FUNG|nr:predicted protein [Lichtheimia corymbifera JMRC:FSU:9682]CDH59645.1 predicted protein [Lichtheimia corymbifera JMRC:FSU:9682]
MRPFVIHIYNKDYPQYVNDSPALDRPLHPSIVLIRKDLADQRWNREHIKFREPYALLMPIRSWLDAPI